MYTWNWSIIFSYKAVFIQGAVVTLELTLLAIIVGTILGILMAFAKKSSNQVLSILARGYIELFRAIPILVLLIWIFYVLPIMLDWRISAFLAAVIALSLNLSAFVAETFRAGVESVDQGQFESAWALGLNQRQTMTYIILPQAIRNMVPNLIGLYINEIKNSSLASIIAVNELLHLSNIVISNTFRPLEVYTTVGIVYLALILPLVYVARKFEKNLSKNRVQNYGYETSH